MFSHFEGKGSYMERETGDGDLIPFRLRDPEGQNPTVKPNSQLCCGYQKAKAGLNGPRAEERS